MRPCRRAAGAAVLALALAWSAPPPALAQQQPGERERAEELAREAMERLMEALELFMQSIPQYDLPEVTEDGDIIIRRKRPPDGTAPKPPAAPEPDSTKT